MPNEAFILEGTSANFAALVLENSRKGPVLVDFWAEWAGPSLRQGDLLRRLARAYAGRFLLVSLNTDREKEIAHRYGVKTLPSCKLFRHGQVAEEIHGMQSEADYRALIDRHLTPLADRAQAAALAAWEAGDEDKGIQVLAEAAMAEPDKPALPLLLAKLLIRQGRHADAHAVLVALPPALRTRSEIRRLYTHLELIMTARDGGHAGNAGAVPGATARDGGHAESARPESLLHSGPLPHPHGLEAVPASTAGDGGQTAGSSAPSGSAPEAAPPLAPDPDGHATLFALGAHCVVTDDYAAALDHFAELERRAPGYRDGLAHDALLLVMDLLGPDDEQVRRYRRSLFEH
jgi:thioredoxin-like negative regulator of GroEL